jgi:sugar phosphate isomerase/epimerase
MFTLACFADEISPELSEQIEHCLANKVMHIELRSVGTTNVLDLSPEQRREIRRRLADAGLDVIGIGSPIGKVRIDEPWLPHAERFKIALDAAEYFGAKLVRIFSYYPPPGEDILKYREQVMERMRAKLELVDGRRITLLHENEVKIYGQHGAQCLDLATTIVSPKFQLAFDFANFVQAGEKPIEIWPSLRPFVTHMHVKDAKLDSGKVVPLGQGDGSVEAILLDLHRSGYDGFLSLEPHLAAQGQFAGFSGPGLFKMAVENLTGILSRNGIAWR